MGVVANIVNSNSATYSTSCAGLWLKTWWQGDPAAALFWGQQGAELDAQLDRMYQARAVAYPNYPTDPTQPQYRTPSDALTYLAAERNLEMVPTESEQAWRNRLQSAWSIWNEGGTQQVQLDQLGWYNLLAAGVYRRHELSTPPAVGSAYVQSFARLVWAQFDIIVQKAHPWQPVYWGSASWGDGTWGSAGRYWGSTMSDVQANYLRRQIRLFKAGHSTCTYLHVLLGTGHIWGLGAWGDGWVWGGTGYTLSVVVGEWWWQKLGRL